jgi:hypothetical protein
VWVASEAPNLALGITTAQVTGKKKKKATQELRVFNPLSLKMDGDALRP